MIVANLAARRRLTVGLYEVKAARADRGITFAQMNADDARRRFYQTLGSAYQARREARIPEMLEHKREVNRLRKDAVALRDEIVEAGYSHSSDEDDSDFQASSDIENYDDELQQYGVAV